MRHLPALLIDGLFIAGFSTVSGLLAERFHEPSTSNAVLVWAVYLLLCGAVYLLRRLDSAGRPPEGVVWLLAVQGLCFGLFTGYLAWESSGVMDRVLADDPSGENLWLMTATLAGIGLAFLYPALIAAPIAQTRPRSASVGLMLQSGALFVVNLATMTVFAFWTVMFAETAPYDDPAFGVKLMIFAMTLVFYGLFFAAPRTVWLALDFSWTGVAITMISAGYWVWQSLERLAW